MLLGEGFLNESGLSKTLFPTKIIFIGHFKCRYTGPSWKQSRRLGLSLTGTGKELARRNYVPGQLDETTVQIVGVRLQWRLKTKLHFSYGLGEKQFRNLFVQATKVKSKGDIGFNFMLLFGTSFG